MWGCLTNHRVSQLQANHQLTDFITEATASRLRLRHSNNIYIYNDNNLVEYQNSITCTYNYKPKPTNTIDITVLGNTNPNKTRKQIKKDNMIRKQCVIWVPQSNN